MQSRTFVNGATLTRIVVDCQVCVGKGEHPEAAHYAVVKDGITVYICEAHCQTLVEGDDEERRKQGEDPWKEWNRK
jgi:hypothetical protein